MVILEKTRCRVREAMAVVGRNAPWLARFVGFTRRRKRPIYALFMVVMHVLGFFYSISAVMSTRTSQGAIAWAISLNTMPVVAVPAWWIFGDSSINDYAATRLVGLTEIRPVAREQIRDLGVAEISDPAERSLMHTLQRISSLPVTSGNRAELLVDGERTFRSIYDAIEEAEEYILVQFYIVRDDGTGRDFRDRLARKAREGVRVYLIYDDYGSWGLEGEFTRKLVDAGAQVSSFMDFDKEPNRFQLNFRNHRKLVVVDGKTAFVGGHNVGDEYMGKHPELTPWRDSHLRISGPVVTCLQVPFMEDWHWATGNTIEGLRWDLSEAGEDVHGDALAVAIPTGPADALETCSMFFHACIQAADKRIWIATPYFVPDEALVLSLQLAAARGVDVRIIIPDLADSELVRLSSYSYLKEMEEAGVEVFRFREGFLHQKVLLVDDDFAALGSANMDNRSLRLNFELMVGVGDAGFARKVEEMLLEDLGNSTPTGPGELENKSWFFRLKVRVARLLAPIQ